MVNSVLNGERVIASQRRSNSNANKLNPDYFVARSLSSDRVSRGPVDAPRKRPLRPSAIDSNFRKFRGDVDSNMALNSNVVFKRLCYTCCGEQERKGTEETGNRETRAGSCFSFCGRPSGWASSSCFYRLSPVAKARHSRLCNRR